MNHLKIAVCIYMLEKLATLLGTRCDIVALEESKNLRVPRDAPRVVSGTKNRNALVCVSCLENTFRCIVCVLSCLQFVVGHLAKMVALVYQEIGANVRMDGEGGLAPNVSVSIVQEINRSLVFKHF